MLLFQVIFYSSFFAASWFGRIAIPIFSIFYFCIFLYLLLYLYHVFSHILAYLPLHCCTFSPTLLQLPGFPNFFVSVYSFTYIVSLVVTSSTICGYSLECYIICPHEMSCYISIALLVLRFDIHNRAIQNQIIAINL